MKASLNKIMIVAVVLLLLPLSIVHNITIKAETAADGSNIDNTGATSEVVGGNDAQKSVIPISQYDIKAGVPITTKEGIEVNISNPGGGDLVKTDVFYPLNIPRGEDGKQLPVDKSMFNFGNDALKDGVATKNYGANARFTAKYGLNDPLKVYNNAPNPRMRVTSLDLNNNAWNENEATNIFCTGQYDIKIEPRYDIQRWDRYRLFDLHNFFTYRI